MEAKLYNMMTEYVVFGTVKKEQLAEDTEILMKEAGNGQFFLEDKYDNRVKLHFSNDGYLIHLSTDPYEDETVIIKHLISNYPFTVMNEETYNMVMELQNENSWGQFEGSDWYDFIDRNTDEFRNKKIDHEFELVKMKIRKPFKEAMRNGGDGINFDDDLLIENEYDDFNLFNHMKHSLLTLNTKKKDHE